MNETMRKIERLWWVVAIPTYVIAFGLWSCVLINHVKGFIK